VNPAFLFIASLSLLLAFALGVWVGDSDDESAFWPHGIGVLLCVACSLVTAVSVIQMLTHFLQP
jgi:hypothetical protein